MTGRNDDGAIRMAIDHRIGDHRRGLEAIAQQHSEAIGGEHFGYGAREAVRAEPGVVADREGR